MLKLCIAPFLRGCQTLLRINPDDYQVCSAVSPSGICSNGVDASYLRNRRESGITLLNDFNTGLIGADVVLVPPVVDENLSEYVTLIEDICRDAKKQLLNRHVLEERIEEKNNLLFSGFDSRERLIQNAVQSIDIPVIYICSFFNSFDCFEVLEALGRLLKSNGHIPVMIAQNEIGALYGNVVLNLELDGDIEENIIDLNKRARWVVARAHADILLVELPKPVVDYSKFIHYDFGVGAYALSKAIPPDGIVFCTSLNFASPDFIANVCESNSLRMGGAWWMVHVGNQVLKTDNEPEDRDFGVCYEREDLAYEVSACLRGCGVPALCAYSNRELEDYLYRRIEADLLSSANMVIG